MITSKVLDFHCRIFKSPLVEFKLFGMNTLHANSFGCTINQSRCRTDQPRPGPFSPTWKANCPGYEIVIQSHLELSARTVTEC